MARLRTSRVISHLGAKDLKDITGPVRAWAALRPAVVESRFEALHATGTRIVLFGVCLGVHSRYGLHTCAVTTGVLVSSSLIVGSEGDSISRQRDKNHSPHSRATFARP